MSFLSVEMTARDGKSFPEVCRRVRFRCQGENKRSPSKTLPYKDNCTVSE